MCLAYGDKGRMEALSKEQGEALGKDCMPFMEDLHKSGRVVSDQGLGFASTTIRPRKGRAAVTDGPFMESKEMVGGVFVIEARDLNEAIFIASKHPAAHLGENLGWGIEVRPIEHGGE